jgi:integrase
VVPKLAEEMQPASVRSMTTPGVYSVGGVAGLKLQITASGAKSWLLRVMVGIKRREIGLGAFPEVSLADARSKARQCKREIAEGIDPVERAKAIRQAIIASQVKHVTFKEVADQFIEKKCREFKAASRDKQRQRLENSLLNYAYPLLAGIPVYQIDREWVLQVLEPIWEDKNPTAERLRNNLERILDLAEVKGLRSGLNPAKWNGNLSLILSAPSKISKAKHHKALPVEDVGPFMKTLRKRTTPAALALRFAILTASRSGEVRFADWSEINLDKALWVVPAERMKAGKQHTVPLCQEAVSLLESIKPQNPSGLVFQTLSKKRLSENALPVVIRAMGYDVTQHGFRSTFKDWSRTMTSYPDEVSELALAHVNDDSTRAAYARDELLGQRKLMMTDWGDFCLSGKRQSAKVLQIA